MFCLINLFTSTISLHCLLKSNKRQSHVFIFRLVHTLDTWIGKQGLLQSENSEIELGLDTSDVLDALTRCSLSKVVTPIKIESK